MFYSPFMKVISYVSCNALVPTERGISYDLLVLKAVWELTFTGFDNFRLYI
jgi:hypothetical protein